MNHRPFPGAPTNREKGVKKKKKKHKEHKRRRTDEEKIAELERRAAQGTRLPPRSVAPTAVLPGAPAAVGDYYYDTGGDRNNVLYDSLYRNDVAQYRRYDPAGVSRGARPQHGYAYGR